MMSAQISPHDWQLLNEYVDNQLKASARARLERRLEREPELRAALESLERVRIVLRSAPLYKAPRSFTLTPQMASVRRGGFTWIPVFAVTSALATILLVVSFIVQWLPVAGAPMAAREAAAPAEMVVAATAEAEAKPTPVIVYWGAPPVPQYDLGRGGFGGGGGGAPETIIYPPTISAPAPAQKMIQPTEEFAQVENLPPAAEEEAGTEEPAPSPEEMLPTQSSALLPEATPTPSEQAIPAAPTPETMLVVPVEPTQSPTLAAEQALPQQPAQSEDRISEPGGPILGISKATSPTFSTPSSNVIETQAVVSERQPTIAGFSMVRIVLAAIAVLSGLTALVLRFSRKS